MKILIIRYSSIGDIVLTTPIIRTIRNQFPHAEIHFLTKRKFEDVLKGNPHINYYHYLDGDTQPLLLSLIPIRFDIVIDLHKNFRSKYVLSILKQTFNSNIIAFTFKKLNLKKWLYENLKWKCLPDKSIVDRYFEGMKGLVKNDGLGLEFHIPESERISKDDLPTSHSLGFVAFSIGGQHETKKMPVNKWKELSNICPYPIVLMGGKEDNSNAEEIKSINSVKIYNACGKFSINESADIISKARVVVTHDTGLMHIAAAFKKPIVSLWGNTTPLLGMFPYYGNNNAYSNPHPQSQIIELNEIKCRPCSKLGHNKCPKGHFKCMELQDISLINKHIERFWKK